MEGRAWFRRAERRTRDRPRSETEACPQFNLRARVGRPLAAFREIQIPDAFALPLNTSFVLVPPMWISWICGLAPLLSRTVVASYFESAVSTLTGASFFILPL